MKNNDKSLEQAFDDYNKITVGKYPAQILGAKIIEQAGYPKCHTSFQLLNPNTILHKNYNATVGSMGFLDGDFKRMKVKLKTNKIQEKIDFFNTKPYVEISIDNQGRVNRIERLLPTPIKDLEIKIPNYEYEQMVECIDGQCFVGIKEVEVLKRECDEDGNLLETWCLSESKGGLEYQGWRYGRRFGLTWEEVQVKRKARKEAKDWREG